MKRKSFDVQSLVDAQETPTVIVDKNYHVVAANKSYCASYGITQEAIIGRCCHEISHRSPVPCHLNGEQCPHHEVYATGKPFEVLHTHYDSNNIPDHVRIKAFPILDADGSTYLMEAIHRLAPSLDLTCEDMRMVGRSPAFLACIENLTISAKSDAPVLLFGETGVGKELAASYIHKQSTRHSGAYVELNCAAIPETLFESELFGHERGAFTGCVGMKRGLFELANGGTLFLDEIGELPLPVQAKLLRVLDSGELRRIGGAQTLKTNARIVAATNRNLMAMVSEGRFREDLYFRIAGIKVNIPPLRERRDDIPALAEVLVKRLCRHRDHPCQIGREALDKLVHHDYPGNVRELRNLLQKAVVSAQEGVIAAADIQFAERIGTNGALHPIGRNGNGNGHGMGDAARGISIADVELQHIRDLLSEHRGNRRVVANLLGISERTLYRKIKDYDLREVR